MRRDLVTRAEAWGLTPLWLGAARDPGGCAGAVPTTWCGWKLQNRYVPRDSGDLVLLYHLLWELTHVVFEHPGLLSQETECIDEICMTCSDEGRVAEVRAVLAEGRVEVVAGGQAETDRRPPDRRPATR